MQRLAFGGIALALMAPAVAADLPVKARPVAVNPAYDWSGFYISGDLGGVGTVGHRFMPDLPLVGLPPQTFTSPRQYDWIYGVHAGVQRQWGRWVLGVEASYSAGSRDMRNDTSISPPEPFSHFDATWLTTDLVTVGPKVGYAFDRFMVYGTGGYAGAHLDGRYSCSDGGLFALPGPGTCALVFGPVLSKFNFGGKSWNDGWFAGAGFDYVAYRGSFADILIGGEYQHYSLDMQRAFTCTPMTCPGAPHQSFLHDFSGDIARVRLTFKTHGWGMP